MSKKSSNKTTKKPALTINRKIKLPMPKDLTSDQMDKVKK